MKENKYKIWDCQKNIFQGILDLNNVNFISLENKKLFQFIGSNDMNGREVCEGDILMSPSRKYFLVKWNEEEMRWSMFADDTIYQMNMGILCVVGNIMENDYLLNNNWVNDIDNQPLKNLLDLYVFIPHSKYIWQTLIKDKSNKFVKIFIRYLNDDNYMDVYVGSEKQGFTDSVKMFTTDDVNHVRSYFELINLITLAL